MNQKVKRGILVLSLILIPLAVHKTLHDTTGLFRLSHIQTKFDSDLRHFFPKKEPIKQKLSVLEFTYLGRGNHAFAFEDKQKQMVIKFLRFTKFCPHFWERLWLFKKRLAKSTARRKDRLHFLLNSITIAQRFLQEETGTLGIYMFPDQKESMSVSLIDRIGRKHNINLQDYCFIVQRKFPLYGKLVPEQINLSSLDLLETYISAYFEVIAARFSKGIMNKDRRGWGKNYGWDGVRAFEIDLGGFSFADNDDLAWEVEQCSRDFKAYLAKKNPQLISLFDAKMAKAIKLTAQDHYRNRMSRELNHKDEEPSLF
jgi:hypothetical protein